MTEKLAELEGLSSSEVDTLRKKYGFNSIEEKKHSLFSRFIGWIISPMSLMFIAAGGLSLWAGEKSDALIILVLFITNIGVGAWHEAKADNAIEKLREKLTIIVKVLRDKEWKEISSVELVPGDIIKLSVGDLIPADITFINTNNLSINDSVITGESLPKEKKENESSYSGAFVCTGLAIAKVSTTGKNTYFGTTMSLIDNTKQKSQLEKDILSISKLLSVISIVIMAILTIALILAHKSIIEISTLDVSMLIAGIPVALPTVMTLIISVGVVELSKKSVIVRRLSSLEDLANVNLLLSDKTGTLTENKIEVTETHFFTSDIPEKEIWSLILAAAPMPKQNPIDQAIEDKSKEVSIISRPILSFIPGDSMRKHTTVFIEEDGKSIAVVLGAPQTIRDLSLITDKVAMKYDNLVRKAAEEGFRAIAVAISKNEREENMTPIAILFLADAVRAEAKETIAFMNDYGIAVKMVTGDGHDVAIHVAKEIGIEGEIITREKLEKNAEEIRKRFNSLAGFAEVLPKDKYDLVKMAQSLPEKYVVAVTGDGVNDVSPIKAANVGFAVANAVDALKGTADIVLTLPGIAVIKDAIIEARNVFTRLYNYSLYRISESFRLIVTIAIIGVIFGTYPLTPVQIILIALLNDVPIISLAFDRVTLAKAPASVDPRKRFTLSLLFGFTGILNSMILLWVAISVFHTPWIIIQTLFFLKLTVSGHMLVYVAHTEKPWYKFLPSKQVIWATIITQIIASLIAFFGIFTTAISIKYIIFVWIWSFLWMQASELAKRLYNNHNKKSLNSSMVVSAI
ncbi:MAG: plasma-membrane proton-efflux P-type ATPase [Candidatus Pacebacteria bacterium]|nr:plasma-membrane proton-efflux P-type ATPase [Candidatus Paceibacterota bacterium]